MFKFIKNLGIAYIMFGCGTVFGSIVASLTAAILYGPADSQLLNKVIDHCGPETVLIVPSPQIEQQSETSESEKIALSYIRS